MTDCRTKVYVTVGAEHRPDGSCRPRWVMLPDTEERYNISRVLRVERRVSQKTGGKGICYTVLVDGTETCVYYEGGGRWFVEMR